MSTAALTRVASSAAVLPQDRLLAKTGRQTPPLKSKAKAPSRVRLLILIIDRGARSLLISGRQEEQWVDLIVDDVNG